LHLDNKTPFTFKSTSCRLCAGISTHLKVDATNIINGISSENPALDFVRCIEYVWSAYEVMGEIMMKIGAMKPVMKDTTPILERGAGCAEMIRGRAMYL
jgi:hypothetical protein